MGPAAPGRHKRRPTGQQGKERRGRPLSHQHAQPFQRRRIHPVQVFHHQRAPAAARRALRRGRPACPGCVDPTTTTAGDFAGRWMGAYEGAEGADVMVGGTGGDQFAAEGEGAVDWSELEEDIDEMTPEEQTRQARWAGLGAFSKGLGQMSHGQEIDVSDVFQDLVDRQKEARDRRFELSKSKIQEQIALGREKRGYGHAEKMVEKEQAFTTSEREAIQEAEIATIMEARNWTKEEAEEFEAEIDALATNNQDPTMKRAAEMVRQSNYTLTMDQALSNIKVDDPELVKMLNHVNAIQDPE